MIWPERNPPGVGLRRASEKSKAGRFRSSQDIRPPAELQAPTVVFDSAQFPFLAAHWPGFPGAGVEAAA